MENQLDNLDKVLWTEEAYFQLGGIVYTKNAFIWSDTNPHSRAKKSLNSPKLRIGKGFFSKIIVPSFFIETRTIDGDNYLSVLQHHVVPYLKAHRKCVSAIY